MNYSQPCIICSSQPCDRFGNFIIPNFVFKVSVIQQNLITFKLVCACAQQTNLGRPLVWSEQSAFIQQSNLGRPLFWSGRSACDQQSNLFFVIFLEYNLHEPLLFSQKGCSRVMKFCMGSKVTTIFGFH
jgi:hypothetical protein